VGWVEVSEAGCGRHIKQEGVGMKMAIENLGLELSSPSALMSIPGLEQMVVLNSKMRELYKRAKRAAAYDATVLVLGETGTGKEHIAKAIHALGNRSNKPFVVVNCGALHRELLESQLFGHERGAFTGATQRKVGFFEKAHGGVLFLDEIGELSLSAQAALLRAVETKKVTRVGSTKEISVDVRIVTATHCDLEAMVKEGTFRQDLLYRLNAITFELPPLRERCDEIEPLIELFLERACEMLGQPPKVILCDVMAKLKRYKWPGNIRQLRNIIERSVLSCSGNSIELSDLPRRIREADRPITTAIPFSTLVASVDEKADLSYKERLRQWETTLISEAMHRANGSQRAAARFLKMPRSTLIGKLEIFGLADKQWGHVVN